MSRKTKSWSGGLRSDCGWCWRHAGARSIRLAPVCHGSGRRDRHRGDGAAVALELSSARKRWPAWAPPDARNVSAENPMGLNPGDPNGQDDVIIEAGTCICQSGSRSKCCSGPSMSCTIFMCPSSGPRWIWSRASSPISGSPLRAPVHSMFSARNCAALRMHRCAASHRCRKKENITRGSSSSRRLPNYGSAWPQKATYNQTPINPRHDC